MPLEWERAGLLVGGAGQEEEQARGDTEHFRAAFDCFDWNHSGRMASRDLQVLQCCTAAVLLLCCGGGAAAGRPEPDRVRGAGHDQQD